MARRLRWPRGSCSRPGPGWPGCSSRRWPPRCGRARTASPPPGDAAGLGIAQGGDEHLSRSAASSAAASGIGTVSSMPVAGGPGGPARRPRPRPTPPGGAPAGRTSGCRRPGTSRAATQHRHARHLQMLQCAGQVEEGLGAGAHRDERVVGDGVEVGRDVARGLGTPVDAADASGREHADPGGGGQSERGGHGGGAVLPARRDGHAKVAFGGLARRTADACCSAASRPPAARRPALRSPRAPRRRPGRRRHRSSASRLAGDGNPRFEKIVDSRATTGSRRPARRLPRARRGAERHGVILPGQRPDRLAGPLVRRRRR